MGAAVGLYVMSNKEEEVQTPRIEVSTELFEWGDIPIDQKASAEVTVKNTGSVDLQINKITTSCSCTTAEFTSIGNAPDIISPGQEKTLEVIFDPQFHAEQELGKVIREVYIKTNDPLREEVSIRFEGNII